MRIIGQPLWSFVTADEVVEVYRRLLARVRQTNTKISFPYRCDSPEKRRFMRMELVPVDGGAVRFVSRLVREEHRDPSVAFRLAGYGVRSFYYVCSFCNHVRCDARWLDPSEAVSHGSLLDSDRPLSVAYAICDGCRRAVSA